MKKMFAVILSAMIVCSFAACGQNNASQTAAQTTQAAQETQATEAETAVIAGGFTEAASPVVPDDAKAVFDKATEALTGASYEPVAYLGSQVVAGTNHLFLCKVTRITEDAFSTYSLVTVYEDLNGGASIAYTQDFSAPATSEDGTAEAPIVGAYEQPETPVVTDEAKAALEKACMALDGATYEAKALLGTQVVSGTNYQMLCKVTPVVADANAQASYAIVTVYQDLEGNAEITEVYGLTAAEGDAAATEAAPEAETSQG